MSRSAVKSRADKSRGASVPPPTPATTTITLPPPPPPSSVQQEADASEEVIPGRLTLLDIAEREEGEEVVTELLEELLEGVMKKCYQLHLHRQLVPFSVKWALEILVRTVECRFLVRDEGEDPDSAHLWTEDTEPQPSVRESWAEGCVPIVYAQQTSNPVLQDKPHTTESGTEKLLDFTLDESEGSSNPGTDRAASECRVRSYPTVSQQPHPPEANSQRTLRKSTLKRVRNLKPSPVPSTSPNKRQTSQSQNSRQPLSVGMRKKP